MKLLRLILMISVFGDVYASGSADTLELMDVVKVERSGNNPNVFESPFADLKYRKGQRVSQALSEYSSVFIKQYGAGQLASLAIRGTSAAQTDIQWNGIRLNSPALGQTDLSLFQTGVQDELQLVRTGYRGAIGGTLMMNNRLRIDSGFSVNTLFRVGSFHTYECMSDAQYAKGKVSGATRVVYLNAANNFTYRNFFEEDHPYRRQQNAAVSQFSVLQQLGFRINKNHSVNVYGWVSGSSRELPPVMSKTEGREEQRDESLRLMADWQGKVRNLRMKFTTSYLRDKIRYINPDALLDDTTNTQAYRNLFSATYFFSFPLSLHTELNYDYENASVRAYGERKHRHIAGLKVYADYYLLKHFRLHGGFREDLVDNNFSAFSPQLAFSFTKQFKERHRFSAGGLASRNFRFPTLNDLYWIPGGNPDLKQERSWNGDIQVKYAYQTFFDISFSNFYIYANDWIQWTPDGNIWMAANLRRVFSRGVESNLHLTNSTGDNPRRFVVHFNCSYSYTRTTNLDTQSEFDMSQGKQLIYVPLHQIVAGMQFQYRRFYLRSVNRFTDRVFTSTDNSQSLTGYFIADAELGKDFMLPHLELGLSFRMNNIGNASYQVVAQRPMPGRNYEATLRFKFI